MSEIRYDGPFWAGVLIVLFAVGAFGCLGVAAASTPQSAAGAQILTTASN